MVIFGFFVLLLAWTLGWYWFGYDNAINDVIEGTDNNKEGVY